MSPQTSEQITEASLESLASMFKALADPARLRILNLLVNHHELCNCHIEEITGYGNSKISRHFAYLKQSGLVQNRREGLWIHYSIKESNDIVKSMIFQILKNFKDYERIFSHDLEKSLPIVGQSACIKT